MFGVLDVVLWILLINFKIKKKNPIVQGGCDAVITQESTFDSKRLDRKRKCRQPPLSPVISLGDVKTLSKWKNVK